MNILEQSNHGYQQWASHYDATDNPLVAMTQFAMNAWRENFQGKRVLEFGSGTGRNAAFFLERGAVAYVGIEPSQAMRDKASEKNLPRTQWLQGSFSAVPQGLESTFDVVLCCLVLEHVEDLSRALSVAAPLLVAGGELRAYELHPALHEKGSRAHFVSDGNTVSLPSYAHDTKDFRTAAKNANLQVRSITEWFASEETARNVNAKLRKHLGEPVLLEVSLCAH